jgi:hypothetical protein
MPHALAADSASLSFSPAAGTFYVGDQFDLQVRINTDTPSDAVDAFFSYPQANLSINSLTGGSAFQAYPGLITSTPGQVKITGFSVNNPITGSGTVANLKFQANQATPCAQLNFNFTLENPPLTLDSNVAKAITSEDILKSVTNGCYELINDVIPPYVTNLNPAVSATNVPKNTNVSFRVRDDQRGVDLDTLKVKVKNTTYTKTSPGLNFSGTKYNYLININPSSDFLFSETVQVEIDAKDLAGNAMDTFIYTFRIGDEPPIPNKPPVITKITPVEKTINGQIRKIIEVEAEDPDGPKSELKFTINGVPQNTPFTDNFNGTAELDYTDLPNGNYFTLFTVTDSGTPNLSDTKGTWILLDKLMQQVQLPPQVNQPPQFKPTDPVLVKIKTDESGKYLSGEEAKIFIEATDPENDPIVLTVEKSDFSGFTFADLQNGTGSLVWAPEKVGLYSITFKATDSNGQSDFLTVSIIAQSDLFCPIIPDVFPEGFEEIYLEDKLNAMLTDRLPNSMVLTRAEGVQSVMDFFEIAKIQNQYINRCEQNLSECLSIFRNYSNFEEINLSANNLRLYPDILPTNPNFDAINKATMLRIITGYYGETNSPFRPERAMTRVEATAMAMRAYALVGNLYKPELAALLGGEEKIREQENLCPDVDLFENSAWWYPRYLNKAIEINLISRNEACRPTQYISEAEFSQLLTKLKEFSIQNNQITKLTQDTDGDGVSDLDEINTFSTDPNSPDTDKDGISDYDEIFIHKTNPLNPDTDGDKLNDYDEIFIHKTNPLNPDTDGDGFNDKYEIDNEYNPLDPTNRPEDINQNFIDDAWERKYGIFNPDPDKSLADFDTDSDGLSNRLEFVHDTDPTKVDTDNDYLSDGEETLTLGTNPLVPNSKDDIKIKITNLKDGQTLSSRKPIFQGVAPSGSDILILARNDFGHEIVLGESKAEQNHVFLFETPFELQNGEYLMLFKALNSGDKQVVSSTPLRIKIDPNITIQEPNPEKIDDQEITEEVILKNISMEILNSKPTITGTTETDSQVVAIWKSLVLNSSIISDRVSGQFKLSAPSELEVGDHKVYLYSIRNSDQAVSETIVIPFTVTGSGEVTIYAPEKAGSFAKSPFGALFELGSSAGSVVALLILISAVGYLVWIAIGRKL